MLGRRKRSRARSPEPTSGGRPRRGPRRAAQLRETAVAAPAAISTPPPARFIHSAAEAATQHHHEPEADQVRGPVGNGSRRQCAAEPRAAIQRSTSGSTRLTIRSFWRMSATDSRNGLRASAGTLRVS
jgi:hypothetical protein